MYRGRECLGERRPPGRVIYHTNPGPPTDVIVITSLPRDSHSKGNRRPDDLWGSPFSGLGSRPSGAWFRCSGSGAGQEFCHPSSVIDSAIFSVGRLPPFSPQRSPPLSPPILTLPSVICHRFSHLLSPSHRYVVTRSRPYPKQRQLGQHVVLSLPQAFRLFRGIECVRLGA